MCSVKFASQLFLIYFMVSPIQSYYLMDIHNDFANTEMDKDDVIIEIKPDELVKEIGEGIVEVADEIDDELKKITTENIQKMTIDVLMNIQKKVQELEDNEKRLRIDLEAAKTELEKEKANEEKQKVIVVQTKQEEKDVEGFWATICRIGKGILGTVMKFLGIKI